MKFGIPALLIAALAPCGYGQIAALHVESSPLTISRAAEPTKPFTVAGERAAIFGTQDGSFEAWQFPVKVLSQVHMQVDMKDYPVPIDVQTYTAHVDVMPAMTTITYSHAAFTIRQHMFSDEHAVVLFEIASVRPLELTVDFRPDMLPMWPAASHGTPNAEWLADSGGFYVLHTYDPNFSGLVAMPGTKPGILAPYQERPKTYPAQFRLSFDPKSDRGKWFPLVCGLLDSKVSPAKQAAALIARVPAMWRETSERYAHFFDDKVTAETPDAKFDKALAWAAIAIEQGKVRFHDETGLIAGFYQSADSARPGFGWFFGRDSLFTTYAANSYGAFDLTRKVLEFLSARQRMDGKIMHEFSQTADLLDWKATPYFYASADATLLYIMAFEDYLDHTGDATLIRRHWTQLKAAYAFSRAHDSDGDGIYENSEGTGWVESWPGAMPHQEIYLAALDQQSAECMSRMARRMGENALAEEAGRKAAEIRRKLRTEYFDSASGTYAFSRNADGALDKTVSIYPSVAWWTGRLALPDAGPTLNRWAAPEFSTDWGTRNISEKTPFYDAISYHQGSVWPLFTGWVALAEYRAGRSLSGYSHLMQNAGLTYTQDLGAVTELLSGEFFQPLGRSSSHQIWSSAMVVTPAIRGLFGIRLDSANHAVYAQPHLPATWDHARLRNVRMGEQTFDLIYARQGGTLRVSATGVGAKGICLNPAAGEACRQETVTQLPGAEVEIPASLPAPGATTLQPKVTGEELRSDRYLLEFEGQGGTEWRLPIRLHRPHVRVSGATIAEGDLVIRFQEGAGYQHAKVVLTW